MLALIALLLAGMTLACATESQRSELPRTVLHEGIAQAGDAVLKAGNPTHSNERFVFDDSTFCITAAQNISMLAPYVFDPWTGYVPPAAGRGERESQCRALAPKLEECAKIPWALGEM